MSRELKLKNITISTMKRENRNLLEALVKEFEESNQESIMDVSGYTALYWLTRYSSIAESLTQKESKGEN